MAFSSSTPPAAQELASSKELVVRNEEGEAVKLGDILENKEGAGGKVVVIFIRPCSLTSIGPFLRPLRPDARLQQDYISFLTASLPPSLLAAHNLKISVIGCGDWKLIAPYRSTLGTPFEVYADSSRESYERLGMTLRTLDMGGVKPEYQKEGMFRNALSSIFRVFSAFKTPMGGGDMKQLGGEFVFENGQPIYVHRMENTRGHAPLDELLKAVGISPEEVKKA
ncbi:hypothetical protein JCM6882_002057 [Rhodosporidiobolus microsporus]